MKGGKAMQYKFYDRCERPSAYFKHQLSNQGFQTLYINNVQKYRACFPLSSPHGQLLNHHHHQHSRCCIKN